MTAPTAWPAPPEVFSFSALREIEGCPRRWQLHHARWGDHDGLPRRANERALVGTIVHAVNEALMRALADRGLPAVGTPPYIDGVRAAAVQDLIRTQMREAEDVYRDHPRDPGFRFRATVRDIANEALRLFQSQYASVAGRGQPRREGSARSGDGGSLAVLLRARGVLAEAWLAPKGLPVRGQVDLLVCDEGGTRVVDLKTGAVRPEYWDQLALYAVLWWRTTGQVPVALEIAHQHGRAQRAITETEVVAAERALVARVEVAREALAAAPADARPGSGCGYCGARAFCDAYWVAEARGAEQGEYVDRELVVEGQVSAGGLGAKGPRGESVAVVFEEALGRRLGPWVDGERLRVLGARVEDDGMTLRFDPGTEVFRR